MLAKSRPNFRQVCDYANKGCTCYMRDVSHKGHVLRKRAQRLREKREDRATLVVEQRLRSLLIRG